MKTTFIRGFKLIGTLIKFIEPSLILEKVVTVAQNFQFYGFLPDIRINMDHVLGNSNTLDMLGNKMKIHTQLITKWSWSEHTDRGVQGKVWTYN